MPSSEFGPAGGHFDRGDAGAHEQHLRQWDVALPPVTRPPDGDSRDQGTSDKRSSPGHIDDRFLPAEADDGLREIGPSSDTESGEVVAGKLDRYDEVAADQPRIIVVAGNPDVSDAMVYEIGLAAIGNDISRHQIAQKADASTPPPTFVVARHASDASLLDSGPPAWFTVKSSSVISVQAPSDLGLSPIAVAGATVSAFGGDNLAQKGALFTPVSRVTAALSHHFDRTPSFPEVRDALFGIMGARHNSDFLDAPTFIDKSARAAAEAAIPRTWQETMAPAIGAAAMQLDYVTGGVRGTPAPAVSGELAETNTTPQLVSINLAGGTEAEQLLASLAHEVAKGNTSNLPSLLVMENCGIVHPARLDGIVQECSRNGIQVILGYHESMPPAGALERGVYAISQVTPSQAETLSRALGTTDDPMVISRTYGVGSNLGVNQSYERGSPAAKTGGDSDGIGANVSENVRTDGHPAFPPDCFKDIGANEALIIRPDAPPGVYDLRTGHWLRRFVPYAKPMLAYLLNEVELARRRHGLTMTAIDQAEGSIVRSGQPHSQSPHPPIFAPGNPAKGTQHEDLRRFAIRKLASPGQEFNRLQRDFTIDTGSSMHGISSITARGAWNTWLVQEFTMQRLAVYRDWLHRFQTGLTTKPWHLYTRTDWNLGDCNFSDWASSRGVPKKYLPEYPDDTVIPSNASTPRSARRD